MLRHVLSPSAFYFGRSRKDPEQRQKDLTPPTPQLLDSVSRTPVRLSALEIIEPQKMDAGRLVEK